MDKSEYDQFRSTQVNEVADGVEKDVIHEKSSSKADAAVLDQVDQQMKTSGWEPTDEQGEDKDERSDE